MTMLDPQTAAQLSTLRAHTRRITLLGCLAVFGTLGLFVVWAALAPLDEGVVAPGVVQTESRRKPIQHPTVAVIELVLVKEGQQVKAGDPLVQLDDAQVSGNFLALRAQYLALKATESRLQAESQGLAAIRFDPALTQSGNREAAAEFMNQERRLFEARRLAFDADLAVLKQSVMSGQEQEKAFLVQLDGAKVQQAMIQEQLQASRDLAKGGFVSRTRLLEDEKAGASIIAQVNTLIANLERVRTTNVELQLRINQRRQEFLQEVDTRATEVRRDLANNLERLTAAESELRRATIVSPADGTVVGLTIQSRGAVVPEGVRIMDIVPQDEGLVIEAYVSPDVVDRMQAGMLADIRFPGFADLPFLAIDGRVLSISADRIEETAARPAHFLARVEVTPEGRAKLGQRQILPGMTAEVVILTGERTLLAYLLKPLVRRLSTSMTEQ
jgi:protease secretion system membrane fusion protein